MMDHYKVLGLSRNATKDEIKESFRKLAMQFHPDKHSQSPSALRESATLKFKQVSEAYEVLIDDRKRAHYNLHSYGGSVNNSGGGGGGGGGRGFAGGYAHYYDNRGNTSTYRTASASAAGNGFVSKSQIALRYLTTRGFLVNLAFVSAILGGTVLIEMIRETLWKMHNSGKSFEEAMESIKKAKAHEDEM